MEENYLDTNVQSWINEASIKKQEIERKERIEVAKYKKKLKKKEKVTKAITFLVTGAIVVGGVVYSIPKGINAIKTEAELNQVNKYMDVAMDFVAPDLDRAVLSNGDVVLFSSDAESLRKLADELEKEFGISRDCAVYCISEKYGREAFDKVVTTYGYENSEQFLYDLYPKNIDGYKSGDYRSFENNVQVELTNRVNLIKSLIDSKDEKVRGLK